MKSAASSRFWGVSWNLQTKKWRVDYLDANDKVRTIGFYNDEEEADPFQEKVDEQLTEMETNLSSLRSASFHIFCNLLAHAFCP